MTSISFCGFSFPSDTSLHFSDNHEDPNYTFTLDFKDRTYRTLFISDNVDFVVRYRNKYLFEVGEDSKDNRAQLRLWQVSDRSETVGPLHTGEKYTGSPTRKYQSSKDSPPKIEWVSLEENEGVYTLCLLDTGKKYHTYLPEKEEEEEK